MAPRAEDGHSDEHHPRDRGSPCMCIGYVHKPNWPHARTHRFCAPYFCLAPQKFQDRRILEPAHAWKRPWRTLGSRRVVQLTCHVTDALPSTCLGSNRPAASKAHVEMRTGTPIVGRQQHHETHKQVKFDDAPAAGCQLQRLRELSLTRPDRRQLALTAGSMVAGGGDAPSDMAYVGVANSSPKSPTKGRARAATPPQCESSIFHRIASAMTCVPRPPVGCTHGLMSCYSREIEDAELPPVPKKLVSHVVHTLSSSRGL